MTRPARKEPVRIEQHSIASKEAIRAVKEIIRRAILTFHALPDPQRHFHYQGSTWAGDYMDDYGKDYVPLYFKPTAHDIDQALVVLPWLKYLGEQEGRANVMRLIAWCHGISNHKQARRENVSPKTIINRIDRSVATIIAKFFGVSCTIEVVEEPYKDTAFAVSLDFGERAAKFGQDGPPRIMTVYVYAKGYMRNGKQWDNGEGKTDRMFYKLKETA